MKYGTYLNVVTMEEGQAVSRIVHTLNPDSIGWEKYARQRKIPLESPFLGMTFKAWHAMRREGDISETFDEFSARVLDVQLCNEYGDLLEVIDGRLVDPRDLSNDSDRDDLDPIQ